MRLPIPPLPPGLFSPHQPFRVFAKNREAKHSRRLKRRLKIRRRKSPARPKIRRNTKKDKKKEIPTTRPENFGRKAQKAPKESKEKDRRRKEYEKKRSVLFFLAPQPDFCRIKK